MTLTGIVAGTGLWTPKAAGDEPSAAMLGPRLRRRTSLLTRMACEALAQATSAAGSDPERVVTVFGTAWGEMQTTGGLLSMMFQDDGALSPAAFHNSVQNAAAGYASIATVNRAPSTTVSAGPATVAMALLEGLLLAREHDHVAVVVADEPLPEPFATRELAPLAVAFVLRREGKGRASDIHLERYPRLTLSRCAPGPAVAPAGNPVAPALALLEALTAKTRPARVVLEPSMGWCAELSS